MACQIKGIANIPDVDTVKKLLYSDAISKFEYIPSDELPLRDCNIALSSAGDVLTIAWNTKMIIFVSKWDSQELDEVKNKFHVTWHGQVTEEANEWVTSVICLPLISLGKAAGPDWTCIAVGYNTGFVRFYTETGAFLLGEQIHNESVLGIKCQSFCLPKHVGDAGSSEEIYVLYNSGVCILPGFSLFSTLRACRNHLAKVQANCNDLPPVTNLSYKKWTFKNQDVANDLEVIGTTSINSFDHLMTASICGGYNATYRSSAPQHNLVLATGKRPFVGFHYALEGGNAPVLSDVAIAMASKLANVIGTAVPWFRGNSKSATSEASSKGTSHESIETMTCRFGLSDIMREGDCVVSSPNKMFSIISDAMGRVILLNNKKGIAVRMWKGYRDAQCGWIEVSEERDREIRRNADKSGRKTLFRTALFLVIYAPKKGVIDIWSIQQGPKITTFTASKNGRLLYINYGFLGTNDNAVLSRNKAQHSCVFVDPLGGLKEICVPFHFALNSKNGKRARDIHLLRKLRTFLREEEFNEEKLIFEITNTCLGLETNEVRIQTLEVLMNSKHILPDALLAATSCFAAKLEEKGQRKQAGMGERRRGRKGEEEQNEKEEEKERLEPTLEMLCQLIMQLQRIVKFYKYVESQLDIPPECGITTVDNTTSAKSLSSILLTSEEEVSRVVKLAVILNNMIDGNISAETKVKFRDGNVFSDFLSCFELDKSRLIELRNDVKEENVHEISRLIYQGVMSSDDVKEQWQRAAKESNIRPFIFMRLALIYWMHKEEATFSEIKLKRLTQLLRVICLLTDVEEISVEYNEVSSWWKSVRAILTESTKPFNAFTAALACRATAIALEKYKEKLQNEKRFGNNENQDEQDIKNGNNPTKIDEMESKPTNDITPDDETYSSISEWENVSNDTCQFTLLIGNLEDVAILNAIISQRVVSDETTRFFALPFTRSDICLASILSRGRGSVSELVAKWISTTGINPARLIDTTDVEFDQLQSSIDNYLQPTDTLSEATAVQVPRQERIKLVSLSVEIEGEAKVNATTEACILDNMTLLKRHFPYSLTSSVLLANLCWEFAMSWDKDVTQLDSLATALTVLRQIPMKNMRHGVCCLLWTLHIKKRMEAVAKLMNKLGKLPKERLCMQDIGLSDIQVTMFLQHCVTFLDIFLDAEILERGDGTIIKSEELWDGCLGGPQAFAVLAISQTPAWYDLILLHVQVANVLYMIACLNLKMLKPLNNLFESVVQPYLFQDITDKVLLTWYRDDKRDNIRTEFLCKIITASMEFIHRETTDGVTISSTQAISWMSKCQTLASIWKINNDELRIHQTCQLYINGFDRLAEEVTTAVTDIERLAANLLPIAGRRMMSYLSKTPNLLEEMSRMSPALTRYLESLNIPEIVCTNCSNADTMELIRRVSMHLSKTHCDYHIIVLMLDATFIYEDNN
ncbi:rab3 GTPase-activating protein non-catalytic subunit isoform X1 [Monomorium pharaonis]|uniref:rab3 GTPase-activating protein non-catalytic subunit isoform X1 n=1 Tax=Monomorium pharaonis TaxID=307658 RepID=UPI0017469B53|nr:rab3 GTPase-activating protein non-catalytic subunit isoform X1 [Monomorium pharaonis]